MRFLIVIILFLTGCASTPNCGPNTSKSAVYFNSKTCDVRIKDVVIGSELSIPESLKASDQITHEVSWADTSVQEGKIRTGHFVLSPKRSEKLNER